VLRGKADVIQRLLFYLTPAPSLTALFHDLVLVVVVALALLAVVVLRNLLVIEIVDVVDGVSASAVERG
jgi:hypothetical protein